LEAEAVTITGLILAGGRGSRMGHVDKGLQTFRGAPMVTHVLQRLTPQVDQIMINANQNMPAYEAICSPVWQDHMQDFAGPLAGLQSGLMHCTTFLPLDLVERLKTALMERDADLAVAVTGPADQRQAHPVFCLVKSSLLPHLTRFLQNGGRKFDAWYASLSLAEVHFADEAAFRNINTLDDLRKFEAA
jgi:molybdopterin-guanine dinucleotide biosynthesis protein A